MIKKYFYLSVLFLLCGVFLVLQQVFGLLPLGEVEFVFLFLVFLAAVFFYPGELFWFFVFLLPFENVIVSPEIVPISMRPYQVVGFALIIATIIKAISEKRKAKIHSEKFKIKTLEFYSKFIIYLLPIFAFLALANAPDKLLSAKQALVLVSFVALFWMASDYLKTNKQKFEALWFFLLGTFLVVAFGIYQAIAFRLNWVSLETMPGRINSTFVEPDWLGMYLVFSLALVLWIKFVFRKNFNNVMVAGHELSNVIQWQANIFLFLILTSLMLTVARSAWLAAVAVLLLYGVVYTIFSLNHRTTQKSKLDTPSSNSKLKTCLREALLVCAIGFLALVIIRFAGLSSFDFFNRAASSVSGLQKITVSCEQNSSLMQDDRISSIDQLSGLDCRHINLEEIYAAKQKGQRVIEVYRPDPNVGIRKNIYLTVWSEIKKHPLLGQGLGSSAVVLGKDEQGRGLNASNIFLEAWLAMGLGGLLVLLWALLFPLVSFSRHIWQKDKSIDESLKKSYNMILSFYILTLVAVVIPNMFNSGLLIGYFWLYLALLNQVTK